MKAGIIAMVLTLCAGIAALLCAPSLTGTWIVKNQGMGTIKAVVFMVGISERGPVVILRHLSARREDQLYAQIHAAALPLPSHGSSTTYARQHRRHWGGGESWCNGEECRRFYVVVGGSLHPAAGPALPAMCQWPPRAAAEASRAI